MADNKKDHKNQMHIEIENLAVPEVRFNDSEEIEENIEADRTSIDFSGAIPEIHIKKN